MPNYNTSLGKQNNSLVSFAKNKVEYYWIYLHTATDAVFLADITHSMKFVSLNVIFLSFPIGY